MKIRFLNIIFINLKLFYFIFLFIVYSYSSDRVKNIIFFIADGMGISSIDVARIVLVGKDNYLDFERAPYVGIQKTYSASSLVTDSAAAVTAMSTGYKTKNLWLGVTSDGTPVKTILEISKEKDKSTGLVTNVTITHATPAGFVAHTTSRDELPIADIYVETKSVDVYLGGGLAYFIPSYEKNSKRKDNRNLISEFRSAGYYFVSTTSELEKLSTKVTKLLGIFDYEHLPYYIDRTYLNSTHPTLALMTKKAIEILSQDKDGFFLMVEGGKIDWALHNHDMATAVWEIYEFNEAVKVALEFIKKDTDTLVLITSDHETGGVGLSTGKYEFTPEILKKQKVSIETLSKLVQGKSDNEIRKIFREYTGITNLTEDEIEQIIVDGKEGISKIISSRSQIGWTTTTHSGESVPVYAFGKGAEFFAGVYDNTDIPKKLIALYGFNIEKK